MVNPGMPRMIQSLLDQESVYKIKHALSELKFSNKTLNENQFLHHVTISFQPTPAQYQESKLFASRGDLVIIQGLKRLWSPEFGVECVIVELYNGSKTLSNQIGTDKPLHITCSTEGKSPVASNDLIKNQYELPDLQIEDMKYLKMSGIISYQE